MTRLRLISRTVLVSWLIVMVFVFSRVPLMPRAIRHGWHVDMHAHYHQIVMARAFVQEGGRTPYLLFPFISARPNGEEEWTLFTSWPPLPYYALTPIVALSRDPQVQIFFTRLGVTLVMALGSWLVFRFFRLITRDDGLALIAQAVSTFELDRYYLTDLPWGSQYGYPLGLIQILLILVICRGVSSRKHIWGAHLVSAVAALTWWLNSLIPLTALALSYLLKAPKAARRKLGGVALSSTFVTLATLSWLSIAELNTGGVTPGTGVVGAGLRGFASFFLNLLEFVRGISPVHVVQTHLEFFLRFVVPPFPLLVSGLSVGQQMTAMGLMPRYAFTIDQPVTLPLAILLFSFFGVLAVRGTRRWLASSPGVEWPQVPRFGLLLFTLPGFVFVALLPAWSYAHPPFARMAITPVGIVLAVGAYNEVKQLIRRNGTLLLAGWLTIWATFGVSMTYSLVRTFDDSYNRAELAALNWFRQHVSPGSVLINNIPSWIGLYEPFDVFYSDARSYNWRSGLSHKLATPMGLARVPRPDEASPYLDQVLSSLSLLGGNLRSETMRQTMTHIRLLKEAVGRSESRPESEHEKRELLDLYGRVFVELRSLNRELRGRGLPEVPLPLPVGWNRNDNYILLREDFGLPPLFRGINYVVKFESEYSTAPDAFLGGRTAYWLICHEEVQGRRVPIRCRHAVRRAMAAILRGDWQAIRSLFFITPQPSHDNFEFPIQGGPRPVGKMRLIKLEGE